MPNNFIKHGGTTMKENLLRCYGVICRLTMLLVMGVMLTLIPLVVSAEDENGTGSMAPKLGSVDNLGAGKTIAPDLFTGAMSYDIPIDIPIGRHGMQPNLAIRYNSMDGDGWLGQKWDLEIGAIERKRRPVDFNADKYVYRSSDGEQDLVAVGGNEYRAKIEGTFLRFQKMSDGWLVHDKSGQKYYFGQTASSRQDDPSNASKIFKWCLNKVEDTNGNYMTILYDKDYASGNNQLYPQQIDYAGNSTLLMPTNQINFITESRNDVKVDYSTGFKVVTAKRLRTISSQGNNNNFSVYTFNYEADSAVSASSQLTSINRYGNDASVDATGEVSGGVAPQVWTVGYPSESVALSSKSNGPKFDNFEPTEQYIPDISEPERVKIGDFNGDGRMDMLRINPLPIYTLHASLYFANSTGFGAVISVDACFGTSDTTKVADFNGDGKTDMLCFSPLDEYSTLYQGVVYYSNGNGFNAPVIISSLLLEDESDISFAVSRIKLADFNGDGKTDILKVNGYGAIAVPSSIYYAASTGFNAATAGPSLLVGGNGTSSRIDVARIRIADFNGDGKSDILRIEGLGAPAIPSSLYLSTGTGFNAKIDGPAFIVANSENTKVDLARVRTGDFNGDGLTDLFAINGYGGTATPSSIYYSSGAGSFTLPVNGPALTVGGTPGDASLDLARIKFADFNGDARLDLLRVNGYGTTSAATVYSATGSNDWVESSGPSYFVNNTTYCEGLSYCESHPEMPGIDVNRVVAADFTGAGRDSLLWIAPLNKATGLNSTPGLSFNLMTSVTEPLGSVITVEYKPSAEFSNSGGLPLPLNVVSAVTQNDGNGHTSRTDFSYTGGYYHVGEHDYRGFNKVTVTGPMGANNEKQITETWFHQGDDTVVDVNVPSVTEGFMKGKPYRVRLMDKARKIMSEVSTTYKSAPVSNTPPYFNPQEKVVTSVCDGDACGINTKTTFEYDVYGNVTRELLFASSTAPIEYRHILKAYNYNSSAWIVSLPKYEQIMENNGSTFLTKSSSFMYYDDGLDCNDMTSMTENTGDPIKGNLTRVIRLFDLSGSGAQWTLFNYDDVGNQICSRDGKLNVSSVAYDPETLTYPVSSTDPNGNVIATEYYGVNGVGAENGLLGQVKRIIDQNGAQFTKEYDSFGRIIKEYDAETENYTYGTASYVYQDIGVVGQQRVVKYVSDQPSTNVGDYTAHWTENYLDGFGRVYTTRSEGPDNRVVTSLIQYDNRGAVVSRSLPYFEGDQPKNTTTVYDAVGRITKITTPDGFSELACYNDQYLSKIDKNGHRIRETRDSFGRLVKVEEYSGIFTTCTTNQNTPYATTSYSSDVRNNLVSVQNAKGHLTTISYDLLGRKIAMTDPDMGNLTYQYDLNGNLWKQTDAKQNTIVFTYDNLNRLVSKDYPSGTDVTYTYDEPSKGYAKGRLTTMTDASGTTAYYYDDRYGRQSHVVKAVDGVNYTVFSTTDVLGRPRRITYPDGEMVDYEYDAGGNLGTVGSYVNFTGYNALGQPSSRASMGENWVFDSYEYNANTAQLSRLKSILETTPSTPLLDLQYAYDKKGNISTITDYRDSTRTQVFVYDGLDRLTSAQSGKYGALGYSYDQLGNFVAKEGVTHTMSTSRPHAVASTTGGGVYVYDNNGNMTSDTSRVLVWDYENRPTSITYGGATTSFVYDGDGNRVKKVGPAGTTVYIGNLYECSGGVCAKYIVANGVRLALKTATQTYFYHQDHLGSTRLVTDVDGNKVEEIFYKPFGEAVQDTGGLSLNHKYTGQELDAETGLYFYNARYYNPKLGKFVSADSVVPDPVNPQSLNRYSYVINNPLRYSDPTGHNWFQDRLGDVENFLDDVFGKAGITVEGAGVSAETNFGGNTSIGGNVSAGGNTNFGGNVSVGGYNPTTGEIYGTDSHPAPTSNPYSYSEAGSASVSAGGHGLHLYSYAYYPGVLSNASGDFAGGGVGYGGSNTANLGSNPFSLMDKVLTTGNAIAAVGFAFGTAAIIVPSSSAAAPCIAIGGAFVSGIGVGWSTYQYYQGNSSLTQNTVNGGIAAASLTTSFIPAPAGPFLNILLRSLEISNSVIDGLK